MTRGLTNDLYAIEAIESLAGNPRAREAAEEIIERRRNQFEKREPAIYFVANQGFIKIGWTVNWPSRISNLQVSSPTPIEVLLILGRPKVYERTMHHQFKKYRVRGEWFQDSPEIREFIESRRHECWYRAGRRK
jgi:hypothetical protein